MESIVQKREVPPMPEEIGIHMAGRGALPSQELEDLSQEGIRALVEKVRTGEYLSVMMSPDEEGEEGYFMLESSPELIFLQIWDGATGSVWSSFNPELPDNGEEAPIEASDKQSVIPLRCTMGDRELAAKCVEWYAHTCEPYPGMDWLQMID